LTISWARIQIRAQLFFAGLNFALLATARIDVRCSIVLPLAYDKKAIALLARF
jgi:hypothetical protein